jgi:hypothetical protein
MIPIGGPDEPKARNIAIAVARRFVCADDRRLCDFITKRTPVGDLCCGHTTPKGATRCEFHLRARDRETAPPAAPTEQQTIAQYLRTAK